MACAGLLTRAVYKKVNLANGLGQALRKVRPSVRPLREKSAFVAQSSSPVSGVAMRYAGSLFELAVESKALVSVEKDLGSIASMISGSTDLKRVLSSPIFSASDQEGAVKALAAKAKVSSLVTNFLRLVAKNRRLSAIPHMISAFTSLAAEHRGEASAEVTSAHPLSDAQKKELAATLKSTAGKDVSLNVSVDPSLLGGLIVKMGSRQIDTTLRTKLNSLKNNLKEAG
jgi:F-type H+-transporting ATPase subunit delta